MIRIDIDLANPGQFFGCCGLFELAQRVWPGTLGSFEGSVFSLSQGALDALVDAVAGTKITGLDAADLTASPLQLGEPFGLRLDWWKDDLSGGKSLKPWAGQMRVLGIAQALQRALGAVPMGHLFAHGQIVVDEEGKKVEPFYFDARRGDRALPLDLGFSPNDLSMKSMAYPASELFTLIGLQRFRPASLRQRIFTYRAWASPLPITLAPLAMAQAVPADGLVYQFENAFRTDQRKHKAFAAAHALPT